MRKKKPSKSKFCLLNLDSFAGRKIEKYTYLEITANIPPSRNISKPKQNLQMPILSSQKHPKRKNKLGESGKR